MTRRIPRWLARAPIPLFRHGAGQLMGTRMMMLEHTGRKTGEPRHTVLEVLDHRPGVLMLVSGYGTRSQWLLNIRAQPAVRIWTGRIRGRPARATVLPDERRVATWTAIGDSIATAPPYWGGCSPSPSSPPAGRCPPTSRPGYRWCG